MNKQAKFFCALVMLAGAFILPANAQNKITFKGSTTGASAPCEGNNFSIASDDGTLVVVIVNAPAGGSADVNDDFFTKNCTECLLMQVTDSGGTEYRAVGGKVTHEGNKIVFTVSLTKADGSGKEELSGEVSCGS